MVLPASVFSLGGESSSSASSTKSSPNGNGGDHSPRHSTGSSDHLNALATTSSTVSVSVVAVACGYRHTVVAATHSCGNRSTATSTSANDEATMNEGWRTPTKRSNLPASSQADTNNLACEHYYNEGSSPRHRSSSGSGSGSAQFAPRTTIWAWGWNQFGQCGQSPTSTLGVGSSGRGVLLTPTLIKPSGAVDWGAASMPSSSSSRLPAFVGGPHQSVPEAPLQPPAMSLPPAQQQQPQQSEYDNTLPPMVATPPRSMQRVPAAAAGGDAEGAGEGEGEGAEDLQSSRDRQSEQPPSPPQMHNANAAGTADGTDRAHPEGRQSSSSSSLSSSPLPHLNSYSVPPSPPLDPLASPQKNMTPRQRQRKRTLSHGSDDAPPSPLAVNFAFRYKT